MHEPPAPEQHPRTAAPGALCVLASGSAGNCTVVTVGEGDRRRAFLIDAGIGPRRTRALLAAVGVAPDMVESIVVTHLDADHWRPGFLRTLDRCWGRGTSARVRVFVHERHARGLAGDVAPAQAGVFSGAFNPVAGVEARPVMLSHDAAGVAAFRFEFASGATLGFATDVGRVTRRLTGHLGGVDVLAIESNYCPRMQAASGRPEFLKRRIMGGSGHLSNQEAAAATEEIAPRSHAVFLHLSRECNRPDLVSALHEGAEYAVTISSQHEPTRWIAVPPPAGPARTAARAPQRAPAQREATLFA